MFELLIVRLFIVLSGLLIVGYIASGYYLDAVWFQIAQVITVASLLISAAGWVLDGNWNWG